MSAELLAFVNPAAPPPANPFLAVFFYVLLTPVALVLQFLNSVFNDLGPTKLIGSFGLAVIVLTLAIRGLLFPLFRWQIRTQWKIQADQRKMGPELRELQAKYKKDRRKLQEETMALYKRHEINPLSQLSGCFPLLIQMPFSGPSTSSPRTCTGTPAFSGSPTWTRLHSKWGLLPIPPC